MYRVIGTIYILAPLLHKSTQTNLINRNLPFWRPFKFWRPYAEKARITQHFGAHALRLLCVPGCRSMQAPVALAAAPHRCKPTEGAKRVENDVKAIQKRVPFTSKCSQKCWRLGLRPRPPIARESAFALASLTR